jgi:hypothetical protein
VLLELGCDLASLKRACPIFMAQSALETAHWNSCHCRNFGNARPGRGWTGDITQFRCNEVFGGKVVWFDPPAPGAPGYGDPKHGSSFRAFIADLTGARDYFHLIKDQWPEAYAAALAGDPVAFVHGLKARGYFTADEAPYRAAVVSLVGKYSTLDDPTNYVSPPMDWTGLAALRASQMDPEAWPLDTSHAEESGEAYHDGDQ